MRHRSSSHAMFRLLYQWNVSACQAFSGKYYPSAARSGDFPRKPAGLELDRRRNMELHLHGVT